MESQNLVDLTRSEAAGRAAWTNRHGWYLDPPARRPSPRVAVAATLRALAARVAPEPPPEMTPPATRTA